MRSRSAAFPEGKQETRHKGVATRAGGDPFAIPIRPAIEHATLNLQLVTQSRYAFAVQDPLRYCQPKFPP
jgi:hypothetical protein